MEKTTQKPLSNAICSDTMRHDTTQEYAYTHSPTLCWSNYDAEDHGSNSKQASYSFTVMMSASMAPAAADIRMQHDAVVSSNYDL